MRHLSSAELLFLCGFGGLARGLTSKRLETLICEHPEVLEKVLGSLKIVGPPGAEGEPRSPD